MGDIYQTGMHGIGIAPQPSTTFVAPTHFLAHKISHSATLEIDKQVRNYQRFRAWEAQEVLLGGQVGQINFTIDVDTVDYLTLLEAHAGTKTTSINSGITTDHYEMGGIAGSARNKLSCRVANGKTDGNDGSGSGGGDMHIWCEDYKSCRVMSLHTHEDDGGSKAQADVQMMGIYVGETSILLSSITYTTDAVLFAKGGTTVTYDINAEEPLQPLALTWGVTSINGGEANYTTVTTAQGTANGATNPTGFSNGSLGATMDALLYASEVAGQLHDDWKANAEKGWTILMYVESGESGDVEAIAIEMPRVQILTDPIDYEGQPRQTVNAIVLGGMQYFVVYYA